MRHLKGTLVMGCAVLLLSLLLARPVSAQGSVTPSFGTGTLLLVGEGYRSGEQVEIAVRSAGVSHAFTVTADPRGRFRLDTGLAVPSLSSLEIEARDEQGITQATITSSPGNLPGASSGGAPLPSSDEDAAPEDSDCPE